MNSLIINALKPLNIPVSLLKYTGTATTYITFFEYLQQGESYADNKEVGTGHFMQIDIWSKSDYTNLVNSAKVLLWGAGFRRTYETEQYEPDTLIYHKILRFYYNEEV